MMTFHKQINFGREMILKIEILCVEILLIWKFWIFQIFNLFCDKCDDVSHMK